MTAAEQRAAASETLTKKDLPTVKTSGWTGADMANTGNSGNERHRANPLFWLVGLAVTLTGLAVMVVGIVAMVTYFQQPEPLQGDGTAEFANAGVIIGQGGVVFTIGRYIWRGARRRGSRDRFGRILIIAGYILVGIAITEALPIIGGLRIETPENQAERMMYDFIFTFACWMIPGAILAGIGTKMAREKILMTVSAEIS